MVTATQKAIARRTRKLERKLLGKFNRNGFIIYENPSIVIIATGFKQGSKNGKTGAMIQTWILRKDINPVKAVKTGLDFMVCGDCWKRPSADHSKPEPSDWLEAKALGWRTFTTSNDHLEHEVVCPASKEGGKRTTCENCLLCGGTSKIARSIQIKPHGLRKDKCYVRTEKAPLSVWHCYKRGRYAHLVDLSLLSGRILRLGSYGDPVLIPFPIMRAMVKASAGHTGYTHQWRRPMFQPYSEFLMASTSARLAA
jgi:hypothetical protein